jgi:hypothetical protein
MGIDRHHTSARPYMGDRHARLEALRSDLDVAERAAAELRIPIAAAEAATAIPAPSPAAPAQPMTPAKPLRIRLIGDSTSHRDGAELIVTNNEVLAAHAPAVTRSLADDLIAAGKAEWVEPPAVEINR